MWMRQGCRRTKFSVFCGWQGGNTPVSFCCEFQVVWPDPCCARRPSLLLHLYSSFTFPLPSVPRLAQRSFSSPTAWFYTDLTYISNFVAVRRMSSYYNVAIKMVTNKCSPWTRVGGYAYLTRCTCMCMHTKCTRWDTRIQNTNTRSWNPRAARRAAPHGICDPKCFHKYDFSQVVSDVRSRDWD